MSLSTNITRRSFIEQAAGMALASGALSFGYDGSAAERRTSWVVACRDQHLRAAKQPDCWAAMKALGVKGVEVVVTPELVCPGLFHPAKKYRLDDGGMPALKEDLEASGLVITAWCMNNRLDERLEQEVAWARNLVKAAQQLKVKAIRIDVVPRALKRDQFLPFAIQACKQLCAQAEGTAVDFGVENHGNTTNDPEFLTALFEGVGSSHLGLTLDVANFYWYGHPLERLYQLYERFGPRVKHTHCKNIRYPEDQRNVRRQIGWAYDKYNCPLYEGDIDFKRLAGILRRAGYRGDLCIEDESLGKVPEDQRADVLRREAAFLADLAKD